MCGLICSDDCGGFSYDPERQSCSTVKVRFSKQAKHRVDFSSIVPLHTMSVKPTEMQQHQQQQRRGLQRRLPTLGTGLRWRGRRCL